MPRNPAARSALVGLVALVVALGWASCHGDSVVGLHPSVALDPSTLRMNPGDGFTLSVRVTDATGRAVAAPNVAWSSSNAAVVSVDTAGAVRAVGLGTASIRATYAAVTARSAVTVIPAATSCADPPGTLVEGEVASGTWRRVDGPYRLSGAVTADSLTLEPGTIVCGDAGATLSYRHVLRAEGSADLPVLFTATSPTDGWGGLRGGVRSGAEPDLTPGEAMLTHALVEYADTGIASGADLVDVVVRQTRGPGIAGPANALRTRVDSACTAGPPCAALDDAPWWGIQDYALEQVRVTGSGADGVAAGYKVRLELNDVRIEGSAGTGIVLPAFAPYGAHVNVTGPLRITDNEYPAAVPLVDADPLVPNDGAVAGVLGNRRDTLRVNAATSAGSEGSATVRPGLPWRIVGEGVARELRVEAGASMVGPGPTQSEYGLIAVIGTLRIEGTAAAPASLSGVQLSLVVASSVYPVVDASDTSRVAYARLDRGSWVRAFEPGPNELGKPIIIEGVTLQDARLILGTPGSRVDGLTYTGSGQTGDTSAVLELTGTGIHVRDLALRGAPATAIRIRADSVLVDSCAVSGSAADAIHVEAGADVRIRACDLHDNGGLGVHNLSPDTVDATGNWWGDTAGPAGPAGDGVAGAVLVSPRLTAPVRDTTGTADG